MRVCCSMGHGKGGFEAAVTGRGGGGLSTSGVVGLFLKFSSSSTLLSAAKPPLFSDLQGFMVQEVPLALASERYLPPNFRCENYSWEFCC